MSEASDVFSRQLEVYEEAWKADHEEVQRRLWQFEDNLAMGLGLYKFIYSRYVNWWDRVARGRETYDATEEDAFEARFAWWLRPCQRVTDKLEQLEQEYGTVEGGALFRRYCLEARQILDNWTSPSASEEEGRRAVQAHTSQGMNSEQLSAQLKRTTRPTPENVPLRHAPDYTRVL
jgi:hypothetical protein